MEKKAELGLNSEPSRTKIAHPKGRTRFRLAAAMFGLLAAGCIGTGDIVVPQPSPTPTPELEEIAVESWAIFGGPDGLLVRASCVQPHITEQGIGLDRHLDVWMSYEAPANSQNQLWVSVRNEETTQGVVANTAVDPQHLTHEFHGRVPNIRAAGPMDAEMALLPEEFYTLAVHEHPFTLGVPDLNPDNRLAQISFAMGCPSD